MGINIVVAGILQTVIGLLTSVLFMLPGGNAIALQLQQVLTTLQNILIGLSLPI